MSKLKLTDVSGEPLVAPIPAVCGARPTGTQILVELLTAQEILGTNLHIGDVELDGAPQGYVMQIGPKVDKEYGIEIGDRVVMSGKFTPLPELDSNRINALVDPHVIKAVLLEDKPKCCKGEVAKESQCCKDDSDTDK